MSDCLFCKIVAGELPATLLAESDSAIAFADLDPQAPLHALVVPREHHENAAGLAEIDPAGVGALVSLARTVARAAGYDDYRLVFNTGAGACQTVFHVHLHVLGGRDLTWPPG